MSFEEQAVRNQEDFEVMRKSHGVWDWLDKNFEKIFLTVLMLALIFILSYQAIGRYVIVKLLKINIDLSWPEEISRIIFIWMTYLAIPISVKCRDMIRVTAVVDHLPKRWQDRLWAASDFLFFIFGLAILYFGTKHIHTLIVFPQVTTATNLSYALLYMILPIGFTLIIIRLIQDIVKLYKESSAKDLIIGFAVGVLVIAPALLKIPFTPAFYMFGYFIVLIAIGVPIAISLGMAALITMFAANTLPISYIATQAYTSIDSSTIVCIPLFIVAGTFMGEGGLSERLIKMADSWLGRISGGLGMATVVACMMFAAMSGSGPATVAAIGSLTIPAMVERGYDKYFSAALVAAAGTIGVMIPPSNPFVVYGVAANASVGDLFMGGITPGVLIGLVLIFYTYYMAKKHGWHGVKSEHYMHDALCATWDAKWALMVPIIILGGIYSGLTTPTEAAAIAALYGLIVGVFLYKGITKRNFVRALVDSCTTSGVIILLIAMATIFGHILTMENIPTQVANFIMGISNNQIIIMLMIDILLLIVGMFMEALAAIVILTPLLLPIAVQCGVDPIHFGVIMVVNLAIGFITPPVGVNLFVASGISHSRLEDISKAIVPTLILMIAVLLLVTFIPGISMWLPNLLSK